MLQLVRNFIIVYFFAFVPIAYGAATNCKIVEFDDHVELICIGDEKSVLTPAPTPNPAASQKPVEVQIPSTLQTSAPQSIILPPAKVPAKTAATQGVAGRRQGRQQYQQALLEAKSSRMQQIAEQEQNKPYQSPYQSKPSPVTEE
jgi:hypothetical protein